MRVCGAYGLGSSMGIGNSLSDVGPVLFFLVLVPVDHFSQDLVLCISAGLWSCDKEAWMHALYINSQSAPDLPYSVATY